jgi:allantoin racemase
MTGRIIVINPNSTEDVTAAMDRALDPLRISGGPQIESVTNRNGPPGIECQAHVDDVSVDIRRIIAERDSEASAYVIACFSDPGMFAARESTSRPVFGIAESGLLTAFTLGSRAGIIAILDRSIPRHLRSLGLDGRLAGDRAIGLGVVELSNESKTFERMVEVGATLRDTDGADVLVMGCAGMARYRDRLSAALGIPVVDPTQAAVAMAIGAVRLGQTNGLAAPSAMAAE